MNQKTRTYTKVASLLLLCILAIVYMMTCRDDFLYLTLDLRGEGTTRSGIYMFYELYSGRSLIVFNFLALLLIPLVTNFNTCLNKINGFDQMIITRTGRRNYYKSCIIQSIKDIWYFPVVINMLLFLGIQFFCVPIFGETVRQYGDYFLYNDLANLIFVTIAQIIGWSLLNCLCFIFSQVIKNKYLYPFILVIFTIGAVIFSAVAFAAFISPYEFALAIFTPFTLLTSGLMALWWIPAGLPMILVVMGSILFFTLLIWILLKLLIKNGGVLYVK